MEIEDSFLSLLLTGKIIRNQLKDLFHLPKYLEEMSEDSMDFQVEDEDIVIFIGTANSGKTSLVNYIFSISEIDENNFSGTKKLKDLAVPDKKAAAETIKFPNRWRSDNTLSGLTLWDMPGALFKNLKTPSESSSCFAALKARIAAWASQDENSGFRDEEQDIANIYFIRKLFQKARSVKIVLVANINSVINNAGRSFLMLLDCVEVLLKDKMTDHFSSVVVIFTKVPTVIKNKAANIKSVRELLKNQFFTNAKIRKSEISKQFLQHLIHGAPIGLFMKSKANDKIDDIINVGIIDAILKADSIPKDVLEQIVSSSTRIAQESTKMLTNVRDLLLFSEEIFYELGCALFFETKKFIRNYTNIRKVEFEELQEIFESITKELFNRRIQLESISSDSFEEKLESLKKFDPEIAKMIEADNLLGISKLIKFTETLMNIEGNTNLSENLNLVLKDASLNLFMLMFKIQFTCKNQEIANKRFTEEQSTKTRLKIAKKKFDVKELIDKILKDGYLHHRFGEAGCARIPFDGSEIVVFGLS